MFPGLAELSGSVHVIESNVSSLVLEDEFVRPSTIIRGQERRAAFEREDTNGHVLAARSLWSHALGTTIF